VTRKSTTNIPLYFFVAEQMMQATQRKRAWILPPSLGESREFSSSGLVVSSCAMTPPEDVETARRHDAIDNDVQVDFQTRIVLAQIIFGRGRD
jgi:hypothetical protein